MSGQPEALRFENHRIRSPEVAHDLALRENVDRRRAHYALGWMLGGAALGDQHCVKMLRVASDFLRYLDGKP